MAKNRKYQSLDYEKLGDAIVRSALANPDVFRGVLSQIQPVLINISRSLSNPTLTEGRTLGASQPKKTQTQTQTQAEAKKETTREDTKVSPSPKQTNESVQAVKEDSVPPPAVQTEAPIVDTPPPPPEPTVVPVVEPTVEPEPPVTPAPITREQWDGYMNWMYSRGSKKRDGSIAKAQELGITPDMEEILWNMTPATVYKYYSSDGTEISEQAYQQELASAATTTGPDNALTEEEVRQFEEYLVAIDSAAEDIVNALIYDGSLSSADKEAAKERLFNAILEGGGDPDGGQARTQEAIDALVSDQPDMPSNFMDYAGDITQWFLLGIVEAALKKVGGDLANTTNGGPVRGTINEVGGAINRMASGITTKKATIERQIERILKSLDPATIEAIADTVGSAAASLIPIPIVDSIVSKFIAQGISVRKDSTGMPTFSIGLEESALKVLIGTYSKNGRPDWLAIGLDLANLALTIVTAGAAAAARAAASASTNVGKVSRVLAKISEKVAKQTKRIAKRLDALGPLGEKAGASLERVMGLGLTVATNKNITGMKDFVLNGPRRFEISNPQGLRTAIRIAAGMNRQEHDSGSGSGSSDNNRPPPVPRPAGASTTEPGQPYKVAVSSGGRPKYPYPDPPPPPEPPPVVEEEIIEPEPDVPPPPPPEPPATEEEQTSVEPEQTEELGTDDGEAEDASEEPAVRKQPKRPPPKSQRPPVVKQPEGSLATQTTEQLEGISTPGSDVAMAGEEGAVPITERFKSEGDFFGTERMPEAPDPKSLLAGSDAGSGAALGTGIAAPDITTPASPLLSPGLDSTNISGSEITDTSNADILSSSVETEPFTSTISDKAINGLWVTPNKAMILSDRQAKDLSALRIGGKLFTWR